METELSRRLATYTSMPAPRAEITGVIDLGEGTALRVASEELEDIRYDLKDAFHGLLTPQDSTPWRPHITIQNKVEPREARRLQETLRATFEPRALAIRGLVSWIYRDGPWEPLKTHIFRG